MREEGKVDPEELENGNILRMLVQQLGNKPCENHYVAVLRCLRDSFVWIPGNIQICEADTAAILRKKEGDTFSPQQDMKFVPTVLRNGDEFFLPVFSNMEQMGEYGNSFSKLERHFFDAMRLALGKEEISGIVLDPFTSPCVVLKGDFDFVGNLPSMLKQSGQKRGIIMTEIEKNDRLKGMLWGLIVGDCLGSPVQFMEMDSFPRITEMIACKHFNTPPGYWTDDGAMALCIMESAVRKQGYDLEDIAQNFIRWYDEGFCSSLPYAFDVGGATVMGIRNLKRGKRHNGAESSQGNGSLMRFAPTLLLNGNDRSNRVIHKISDLTHASRKVRETLDQMAKICRDHLQGNRTACQSEYTRREDVNNSGWAVSTLQAALWAFQTTDSFEKALIEAVNLGGDADSIGAVCGQIAGAYYGYSAIPERWLSVIKDRKKLDALIDDFIAKFRLNE